MLNDPVLVALLARAGGSVILSKQELEAAHGVRVLGSRNPLTGDVSLKIGD